MEEAVFPEEVDIEGANITIRWDDGRRSIYPHRFLRLRCPCASCVEEMTGRPRLDPATVPEDVRALDQMPVGNYAIQFLWSDAHYTGIYTYRYLRDLDASITSNEDGAMESGRQG